MQLKVGDLCKHFKGKTLLEKNIYEIIAINAMYTGENAKTPLDNLVIYKNIFQDSKCFVREYNDLIEELPKENQEQYGQIHRVEKLTKEEIEIITSKEFIEAKKEYIERQER